MMLMNNKVDAVKLIKLQRADKILQKDLKQQLDNGRKP